MGRCRQCEFALGCFKSGVEEEPEKDNKFNANNWTDRTANYGLSIANLPEKQADEILAKARAIAAYSVANTGSDSMDTVPAGQDAVVDARARII